MRVLVAISLALLLVVACDRRQEVTVVNETPGRVSVYRDGSLVTTLRAHERQSGHTDEFGGTHLIEARAANGIVLMSEELSWDDLRAREWTIVIRPAR